MKVFSLITPRHNELSFRWTVRSPHRHRVVRLLIVELRRDEARVARAVVRVVDAVRVAALLVAPAHLVLRTRVLLRFLQETISPWRAPVTNHLSRALQNALQTRDVSCSCSL